MHHLKIPQISPSPKALYRFALLLLPIFLLFPSLSTAADSKPSAATEESELPPRLAPLGLEKLMDIEVTTVTRMKSTVGESAAAVTVITQEDIRRSGATTIPELFRRVPGMNVARIDNSKWAISARGFNQRFFGKMLVQIDGRSLYSQFTSGVYWDAVDYPLEDIERIEVIRGPRAGVWGANAMNGIINIVTKSSKDTQGGLVVGGGGNQEQSFGTFQYGGEAGTNLVYRVYGKGFNRAEQFTAIGDPHDAWWGASGGFRTDWEPNHLNLITFQGDYLHSSADRRVVTPQPAPPFSFQNLETETTNDANLLGRWTHTTSDDSSWTLQAYWDDWRRYFSGLQLHLRWDTYDVDFNHQFRLGERQKIIWGAGYRLVDSNIGNSERDNGFAVSQIDNLRHTQTFSLYVEDEITLVKERLKLSLSARFEHNDFTGFEIQPSGQLLFTPTEKQTFWASLARAVRTPNLNDSFSNARLLPAPTSPPVFPLQVNNQDLSSETVLAYQLGYRIQATSNLSFDTALFYNDYNDLATFRPEPIQPGPSGSDRPLFPVNGLKAETYGAELAATWRVLAFWRLYGAYTLLKMHVHREAGLPASAEAIEGQSPQNQVFVQSSFDLPLDMELDLIGRWVDRLTGFNPNGAPGVANEIPSYFALDARVAWHARKNLELSIVGQNLSDSHHPEFGTSPLVRAPLVEIRRSVNGKVTWTF